MESTSIFGSNNLSTPALMALCTASVLSSLNDGEKR
jgi:hypothetical protein